ncbi:hypothetical protein FIV00_15125 [Labrenzia sp. THAF82]|uniref:hypothetical protein n=1 Tax=Labrenzia sp. THAF82 TaxID=2587861 RepID=UPI00126834E0|nr:hypothetical protein [Labrenzia sp. THAF82]QFT31823.1 hypothetical protein FIV00_15125 [Labrenzia sp. THAF82]
MFGLGKLQLLAISVIAGLVLTSGVYWKGRFDGISYERRKTLQTTINQLKERAETDAEISDMDIPELCGLLGGSVRDDGECE